MATATRATKAPKEKLTLRDAVDLYGAMNSWIDEHVDELELNGGGLPDDLATMLDEIDGARADKVDGLAKKLDEFTGYATTAKATKDRAARREKIWNNVMTSLKQYALRQVERSGGDRLEGNIARLRIQINSAPAAHLTAPPESHQAILLAAYDEGGIALVPRPHPLARFITVQRVATLDLKALGAAYEARREELEREAEVLDASDIDLLDNETVEQMHDAYVADSLANEFPGVSCVRGHHLRID